MSVILSSLLSRAHAWWVPASNHGVVRLYQAALGLLCLGWACVIGRNLQEFYAAGGYVSRTVVLDAAPSSSFSVFFLYDQLWFVVAVYLAYLVGAVLLITGKWTRLGAVLGYVAVISFTNRFPLLNPGTETVLANGLFFAMFLPSGWGLRMIQVHAAAIMFFSAVSKLVHTGWMAGTILPQIFQWQSAQLPLAWLTRFEGPLALAAYVTIFIELGFAFLIWFVPTRRLFLLGGLLLMTGISLTLNTTLLAPATLVLLLSFVTAEDIERVRSLASRVRGNWRPFATTVLCSLVCVLAVLINLRSTQIGQRVGAMLLPSLNYVGAGQQWSMFSGHPVTTIYIQARITGEDGVIKTVELRGDRPSAMRSMYNRIMETQSSGGDYALARIVARDMCRKVDAKTVSIERAVSRHLRLGRPVEYDNPIYSSIATVQCPTL